MRNLLNIRMCAVAFLVALVGTAVGQTSKSSGKGYFDVDGSRMQLVKAGISLFAGEEYSLSVESDDKTRITVKGRWSGSGNHRNIWISEGPGGKNAKGSGDVTFFNDYGGGLRSIFIRGQLDDGSAFVINFKGNEDFDDSRQGNQPRPATRFSFHDGVFGRGTCTLGVDDNVVKHVDVQLSANGDAKIEIELQGGSDIVVNGRWTASSSTYKIRIDRISGADRAKGTGEVIIRRGILTRITLTGSIANDYFGLDFNAE